MQTDRKQSAMANREKERDRKRKGSQGRESIHIT